MFAGLRRRFQVGWIPDQLTAVPGLNTGAKSSPQHELQRQGPKRVSRLCPWHPRSACWRGVLPVPARLCLGDTSKGAPHGRRRDDYPALRPHHPCEPLWGWRSRRSGRGPLAEGGPALQQPLGASAPGGFCLRLNKVSADDHVDPLNPFRCRTGNEIVWNTLRRIGHHQIRYAAVENHILP